MGNSAERMSGWVHVQVLLCCPLRGGCASYFYTLTVSYDHIVLKHYAGKVEADVLRQISQVRPTNVPKIIRNPGLSQQLNIDAL